MTICRPSSKIKPVFRWMKFLRRTVLTTYVAYYHRTRTHLGLDKDTPDHRPLSNTSTVRVVAIAEVGGLHHRYERLAA